MTRTVATIFLLLLFLCPLLGLLTPDPQPPDLPNMQLGQGQGYMCLTQEEIHWLQQTVSSLANDSDHMTRKVTNHMQQKDGSSAVVMETWVELFQLHDQVNDVYANFTSWIKGSNWTETDKLMQTQSRKYFTINETGTDGSHVSFISLWTEVSNIQKNFSKFIHKSEYTFSQFVGSLSELDIKSSIYSHKIRQIQQSVSNLENSQRRLDVEWNNLLYVVENQTKNNDLHKLVSSIKENSDKSFSRDVNKAAERSQNRVEYHMQSQEPLENKMLGKIQDVIDALEMRVTRINGSIEHLHQSIKTLHTEYGETLDELKAKVKSMEGSTKERSVKITRENCNGYRRHLVDNSCYYIPALSNEDKLYTWWDARYICKNHLGENSDLVAIETKHEMDNIKHLLSNHFGGLEEFWLGASYLNSDGHWTWVMSGRPLNQHDFSNWAQSPSHNTGSNCMSLLRGYAWADEPCFYEKIPLCELKLNNN